MNVKGEKIVRKVEEAAKKKEEMTDEDENVVHPRQPSGEPSRKNC